MVHCLELALVVVAALLIELVVSHLHLMRARLDALEVGDLLLLLIDVQLHVGVLLPAAVLAPRADGDHLRAAVEHDVYRRVAVEVVVEEHDAHKVDRSESERGVAVYDAHHRPHHLDVARAGKERDLGHTGDGVCVRVAEQLTARLAARLAAWLPTTLWRSDLGGTVRVVSDQRGDALSCGGAGAVRGARCAVRSAE